jgi:hypothetical protein
MRFPNPLAFIRALWRTLSLGLRGNRMLVRESVRQHRLKQCESCPHFDPSIRQCNRCTCFADLKAELTAETCPDDRW